MGIVDLLSHPTHFSGITQNALPKMSKVGVSRTHRTALPNSQYK